MGWLCHVYSWWLIHVRVAHGKVPCVDLSVSEIIAPHSGHLFQRRDSWFAFTAFTFAEQICFCLAFLCFCVVYCSRETKRCFGFTMFPANRHIGWTRKNWLLCWFRSSKESEKDKFTYIDKTLSTDECKRKNSNLILDSKEWTLHLDRRMNDAKNVNNHQR